MKRLTTILAFLAICTQLLAEGNYHANEDYYKSIPFLQFQKIKDRYVVRLHSNDKNSYEAKERRNFE